MSAPSN